MLVKMAAPRRFWFPRRLQAVGYRFSSSREKKKQNKKTKKKDGDRRKH
jgi:hypothetical protein